MVFTALPVVWTVASCPALSSRMAVEIDLVLGELLAVDRIGGQHVGEEVFLRRPPPLGDHLAQIGHEIDRRLVGVELGLVGDAVHVHLDHAVGPVEQLRRHLGGQADHLGDDDGRDRRGEGFDQLGAAIGLEAVDDLVGQPLDARPQLLDMARDEGPVDQRAQPRVRRRLERQQRIFLGQVEGGRVRLGGAQPSSSRVATWRISRPKRLSRAAR